MVAETVAIVQCMSSQPNGPWILSRMKSRMNQVSHVQMRAVVAVITTYAAASGRPNVGMRVLMIVVQSLERIDRQGGHTQVQQVQ